MTYSNNIAPSTRSESIQGAVDDTETLSIKNPCSASTISLETSRSDNAQNRFETRTYMTQSAHGNVPSPLDMRDVRSILPGLQSHSVPYEQLPIQQPFAPTAHPHGVVYAMHPLASFPGAPMNASMSFNAPFYQFYPPYIQQQHGGSHLPRGPVVDQSLMPHSPSHLNVNIPGQASGYGHRYYLQSAYMAASELGTGPPVMASSSQQNSCIQYSGLQSSNSPRTSSGPRKGKKQRSLNIEYDVSKTIVDGSTPMRPIPVQPSRSTDPTLHTPYTNISNASRGPSRKPKQSGNALWVGNLPPGTSIVDLKDYFSRDATKELESVFLIPKSNCAFINYKTAISCSAALSRFNDSRFQGARLVCRLRQGTVSPGSSNDPLGSSTSPQPQDSEVKLKDGETEGKDTKNDLSRTRVPSKYFIVKSLTVDDLELSRQSNIWATQTHNEEQLNQAYETADDVFLIFSANKSGEYYGYARMMSPIQDDESLSLKMPLRLDNNMREPESLDVTPTPATSTAPNGRIINDSARGAVFWEAESSEEEGGASKERITNEKVREPTDMGGQLIGKPFRIRWLSTTRVSFHRTRGLRNPWNANREVKIARDGTEIEPEVGRKLVQLFHSQPQD
ncbi:hypothetical protein BO70DRAFT_375160 [Aspergillus heteromorphus CBS 117.55]|uniref:YT521-B-like splicing factor n=1 Tax=Aspergillus heteromorphus CBS 117.55 TaxID=1448321 RepID=A0A317UT56_9EURO|nr:uncharacterized protein BO70DRAFT_375160 [Aspergillus heteromorphus CBS 117.55]PWY64476.1 hypothetical protein BO70DRAFT_375160 [Aspergillus heteromorphus CBS 117.55]